MKVEGANNGPMADERKPVAAYIAASPGREGGGEKNKKRRWWWRRRRRVFGRRKKIRTTGIKPSGW